MAIADCHDVAKTEKEHPTKEARMKAILFDVFGTMVDWRLLRLPPEDVMLCAAHNADLHAARALGMKTAFIPRRTEYGAQQDKDLEAEEAWDFVAEDLVALSERLIRDRRRA